MQCYSVKGEKKVGTIGSRPQCTVRKTGPFFADTALRSLTQTSGSVPNDALMNQGEHRINPKVQVHFSRPML